MHVTEITIPTQSGRKYLIQLCKHFRHKVAAGWSDDGSAGQASLPPGLCTMLADDAELHIRCEARDETGVAIAHHIIREHLIKFAFRETIRFYWCTREEAEARPA